MNIDYKQHLPNRDNESLIAILCYLMYSKDKEDIQFQFEVLKELENRGVIKSALRLYELIK
jgi:hypothetical protein